MSAIVTTYPLDGITYGAADAAGYNSARTSGVYSAEEDYTVTPAGGYTVKVSGGRAWVHPAKYVGYSIIKQEPDTLTLPLADAQRPRIDRVVLRYDAAARKSYLLVLEGTPASTPTAPAISRTNLLYDLCLAQIARPAGSTAITAGNITDTRLDESLCGVMSDGVTRIPTQQLVDQAKAKVAGMEETATASARDAEQSAKAAAQSQREAASGASTATTKAQAAAQSAQDASTSQTAAAGSASTATSKAQAAASSATAAAQAKTAAAGSAAAADTSAKAAAKSAAEAKAAASTDKTLTMDGAPADAKATGDALAKRYTKDQADAKFGTAYTLPTATASRLGGVKVGDGLKVYSDGTLSVTGSASTDKTLTLDGAPADAKATGDALAQRYTKDQADAKFGTAHTMTGATSMAAGKAGLVPAPAAGEQEKYLRGDGTWQTPTSTNTWRGIQNNLTSTSTQDSLSAYQGKVLKDLVDKKAESNHTHNYAGANFPGGTALSVNGFTIRAQTTDPGVGSALTTGTILLVYA